MCVCQGFRFWRNHVTHAWFAAHRGDGLLGNKFENVDDRDVTQTLSDTQRRRPVLDRERRGNVKQSVFYTFLNEANFLL